MNNLNDIPKYHKQKESNISKSQKKSKHKHQYAECLIRYYYSWYKPHEINENSRMATDLRSYCTICGKISRKLKDSIITKEQLRTLTNDSLYETYKNKLPVFYVNDIFTDYIPSEQMENTTETDNMNTKEN